MTVAAALLVALAGPAEAAPKKSRDVTPPQTITAQPPATTTATSASFSFSSSEAGSFECKLDTAAFAACQSPKAYRSLPTASHTFQVRATDRAGNVDTTPATYTWQIEAATTPITSGTLSVPSTIASDCSAYVHDELTAFFKSVPDGATVDFPANGCYKTHLRVEVARKSNLTIHGNGSWIKSDTESTARTT